MTAIEDAMRAAMADAEKVPDFYDLFLATEFLIPTHKDGVDPGARGTKTISAENPVEIMIVEHAEGPVVPIFDEETRLSAWVLDAAEAPFISLSGRQLVLDLDPELLFVLNPGGQQVKLFVKDELEMLRASLAADGAAQSAH